MYRLTILSILLVFHCNGRSQEPVTFRLADSLTYNLFVEKNWSGLIKTGKEAINNGHDYYYMRMRLGIAYYEKHNYRMSSIQFRKALDFNKNDPAALEYLFYSCYLSGRNFQALNLIPLFYEQNQERILRESRIKKNHITFESFYSNAKTEDMISSPGSFFSNPEPGSQMVTRYFINNALYASHTLGRNLNYFHSYTSLVKDNYLHYFDGYNQADMTTQRVIQNQYYGSVNIYSSSGWVISPAFHFLTAEYPLITIIYQGFTPINHTYRARTNSFAGGMAITRSSGLIDVSAEAQYSKLNNLRQVQGTLSLMIYPAGNRELYLGGKLSTVSGLDQEDSGNRFIKGFTAGFSIKNSIWFEFSGISGDMKNFTENNGLIVYYSMDDLHRKYSLRIILPLYKPGITLFAGCGISSYSSEYFPFDGINSFDSNNLDYNSNTLTGGLSWNF